MSRIEQLGSNVDIATYHELDQHLSQLSQAYDGALEAWKEANDVCVTAEMEYADVHAEAYRKHSLGSTKITEVKLDTETDPNVVTWHKALIASKATKLYAEKVMTKITKQISAAQTRAKMWQTQLDFDKQLD